MIDALDEVDHNLKDDLLECIVDYLGKGLPNWLAVLMTSRPEKRELLEQLNPMWLDEAKYAEECNKDAKLFCEEILNDG